MTSKEKFPGLDAIRAKMKPPGEKKRPGRKMKDWTPAELAKLAPSDRARVRRRTQAVATAAGVVRSPRPNSLDDVLLEQIVAGLVSGAPIEHVAGALGVRGETIADWLRRGDDPTEQGSIYAILVESVARAKAQWWQSAYATIRSGRPGWKGAAWLAERLDRTRLSPPTTKLEHSGPGGGAIRVVPRDVELPEEVPDLPRRPELAGSRSSLSSEGADHAPTNGVSNGHSNGHAHHLEGSATPGLELPEEDSD